MTDDVSEDEEVLAENADAQQAANQAVSINETQFRNQVRYLVDLAFTSGLDPDQVEDILSDLSNGVQYFYEDLQRYGSIDESDND